MRKTSRRSYSKPETGNLKLGLACIITLLCGVSVHAQVATGAPPFGSFAGGPDVIDLSNLNVHWSFPIFSKGGRGTPFSYALTFDNSIWYPVPVSGQQTWQPVGGASPTWGWGQQGTPLTGYITFYATLVSGCGWIDANFVYHDPSGTGHPFSGATVSTNGCSGYPSSATTTADDSSGYKITTIAVGPVATIYPPGGGTISPPLQNQNATGTFTVTDSNGNFLSTTNNGSQTTFTDTTCTGSCTSGATALTIAGSAPNPVTYSYTAPNGGTASVTVSYVSYNVRTTFCAPNISDVYFANTALVDKITYLDGSYYQFTYETTPPLLSGCTSMPPNAGDVTGRIASVRLATGGTITYNYHYGNGYNSIWTDGSTTGFFRVVSDGVNPSNTWTYSYNLVTHVATVSDPSGNDIQHKFSGLYETERVTYQGSAATGTLVKTVVNCYNGVWPSGTDWSPCINATVTAPITSDAIYQILPNGTTQSYKWSAVVNTYNSNGLLTESDAYEWSTGAPVPALRLTSITYASLGNNIVDRPSSVIVKDGNNNIVAQTNYFYDQTGVTPTSGTPQLTAVSGSRGDLTQVDSLVAGSTYLHRYMSYYDTGMPKTTTDVNAGVTTYNYADLASTCGNAFATSVTAPITTLVSSTTWNCTGAVATQTQDANNQPITTTYNDPNFWRPASVTDPLGNVSSMSYTGAVTTEGSMSFNGNLSLSDSISTVDGLGRQHFSQRRQGPTGTAYSTFDSAETDYDSNGRPWRSSMPYVATNIGQGFPAGTPVTTTSYDGLNRPTQVTDGGGGTVSYSYFLNDVLVTIGPMPSGENAKKRQYEYDGLGRLISVCEIVTDTAHLTNSGPCSQSNPLNGYLTKYTYDAQGHLTGVTQNAQTGGNPQTRSFSYDGLGRMTSETNPETGTVTYTYDSIATGNCAGTYAGDLLKKLDNAGNVTCYAYDTMHRVTSITYPSGPNAAATPSKGFIYDAFTYQTTPPTPMANAKGRLAVAYTCCASGGGWLTWSLFSYTARGEVTEMWESTPHAASPYHVTASYAPHGMISQISGLPGMHVLKPTVDSEGRYYGLWDATAQAPALTSTSYNTAGEPTSVVLPNGDSDGFTYDSNTGRLTQYTFNVNGQADTGTLTWNANGSLKQLLIVDNLPGTSDGQTCNYAHDDLSRLGSVTCTIQITFPVWVQNFSYDAFGNITKSGNLSFNPGYVSASNQFVSHPPQFGGPSYDNNGNVSVDVGATHYYTWDAEGHMIAVDNKWLVYDALGRMVEQYPTSGDTTCTNPNNCTQIVYGPSGDKLALMHGQTLSKAFVPLPGGATAVYNSSGLAYYRHSDHLGSSRLASTPSRTLFYSGAYAPFGESYAETGTVDHSFTGQNEDTVAGLADFMYREYSSAQQGRWISPDPSGLAAVNPMNPQSWNRYAYVGNRPLMSIDPLGLTCWDLGGGTIYCDSGGSVTVNGGGGSGWVVPFAGGGDGREGLPVPEEPGGRDLWSMDLGGLIPLVLLPPLPPKAWPVDFSLDEVCPLGGPPTSSAGGSAVVPTDEEGKVMFQFGQGLADMKNNLDRMRWRNWKNSDLFYHCVANCQATNEGPGGAMAAEVGSFFRTGVSGRLTESDWRDDDVANRCGQRGGNCAQRCGSFVPPGHVPFPGW